MFGDPDPALKTAYGYGGLEMTVQARNTGLSAPRVGWLTERKQVKCRI